MVIELGGKFPIYLIREHVESCTSSKLIGCFFVYIIIFGNHTSRSCSKSALEDLGGALEDCVVLNKVDDLLRIVVRVYRYIIK